MPLQRSRNGISQPAASAATLAAVNLGAAGNYVILAKTAINNNPGSAITGDLGLSPAATSYITGFICDKRNRICNLGAGDWKNLRGRHGCSHTDHADHRGE
jgi:hypothetical protein